MGICWTGARIGSTLNSGVLLFVTNGVTSSYHAFTSEIRRELSGGLSPQANYRRSKWLDTSSDTSTGQFADNAEPGKGATNIDCLRCEKALSLSDIPHRPTAAVLWSPTFFADRRDILGRIQRSSGRWRRSSPAQSGLTVLGVDWRRVFGGRRLAKADGGGGAVGKAASTIGRMRAGAGPVPSLLRGMTVIFLNGLFDASTFPKLAPGANGTLDRNTFRAAPAI